MQHESDVPLAPLTTLHMGGPAKQLVTGTSRYELVAAVAEADAASDDVLILAGGSNVVVSDTGFPGTVVLVRNRGSSIVRDGTGAVRMTVQAGEPWDVVVARAVAEGLSGIECLSGIPGSTGATPIQNVGAYGQEVAETITGLRAYDRARRCVVELSPADCRFSYRNSALKQTDRHVVLDVTFTLTPHEFDPERVPDAPPDLARETEQIGCGASAEIGQRKRVLGRDAHPVGAVPARKPRSLDQPRRRRLDPPVGHRPVRWSDLRPRGERLELTGG